MNVFGALEVKWSDFWGFHIRVHYKWSTTFLHSIKSLFIVDAASVAETDKAEQNSEEEEEDGKIELESSESESEEGAGEEKKKKKRVGFRDRKVSLLHGFTEWPV